MSETPNQTLINTSSSQGFIYQPSGSVTQTFGFTVEQVSILLKQISVTFQPKPFDGRCPYVGLAAFDEQDADRFFGREGSVAELVARVKESRFVVITGPSGSGKSSIVRAGLIRQLKQGALPGSERWLYESLKPGRNPLIELGRVASSLAGKLDADDDIRTKGATDSTVLQRWVEIALKDDRTRRAVILVDQFEEVFTQVANEAERIAFLNLLTQAATAENGRVTVLFTLRSDFVSNCASYPQLNALLNQQFFQMGAMKPGELVSAIALPALRVGLRTDPDLIAQIVNDIGDEPGALPLMQFALKDLFDAEQAKGGVIVLTLAEYLARGGLHKALERHADAELAHLSEQEQKLAHVVFAGLIQVGRGTQDTRRTATFDELVPAGIDAASVQTVIRKLADARLVTTDERNHKDTVTIAHERLIESWTWLQRLVVDNRDIIELQNRINEDAAEWDANKRDPSYLYVDARLATAQEQLAAKKLTLSNLAQMFVQAGIVARDAAQRRRRRTVQFVITGLATAVLVFAILAGWATIEQQKAVSSAKSEAIAHQASETSEAIAVTRESEAQAAATAEAKQRQVAEAERKAAEQAREVAVADSSRHLASLARTYLDDHLDQALLLSLEAYAISTTVEAKSSLLAGVVHNPHLVAFLQSNKNSVQSMAVTQNGSIAVSAGDQNGSMVLWNLTKHISQTLPGQNGGAITSIAINSGGQTLVAGDASGNIVLWDLAKPQPVDLSFPKHAKGVTGVAISPDGRTITSSSCAKPGVFGERPCLEGEIRIWQIAARPPYSLTITTYVDRVLDIALSPDGLQLASAGCSDLAEVSGIRAQCIKGEVDVWDVKTGHQIAALKDGHAGAARSLAFRPNGQTLASGGEDGQIVLWDTNTWQQRQAFTGHSTWVVSLAFSQDGQFLVSGGCGKLTQGIGLQGCLQGEIRVWETSNNQVRSNQPQFTLTGHSNWVTKIAFLADSHQFLSSGLDGKLILWDLERQQQLGTILARLDTKVLSLAFDPSGKILATGGCQASSSAIENQCTQGEIQLWDTTTLSLMFSLTGHTGLVTSLAFSPDGKLLASGSSDHSVLLWDISRRQALEPALRGHADKLTTLAFSPDGHILASGGSDADPTIRLWDVSARQLRGQPLSGHQNHVTSLSFSADGHNLASASGDSYIIIWDVATGEAKFVFSPAQAGGPVVAAFNPVKTQMLVSGSLVEPYPALWTLDSMLWDSDSALWQSATITGTYLFGDEQSPIALVAFSPDGQTVAAVNGEGKINLWGIDSQQSIGKPQTNEWLSDAPLMAFNPDGRWLATTNNNTVILWDLSITSWLKRACQRANRSLTPDEEWQQFFSTKPYVERCSGQRYGS